MRRAQGLGKHSLSNRGQRGRASRRWAIAYGPGSFSVQDSFSRSHRGLQKYRGVEFLVIPFLGLDHIMADLTPTRTEQYMNRQTTKEMILKWKDDCACRK